MRLFILSLGLLLVACSTRVTGLVTGREYNLDVGCTDDMQAYAREREQVVAKEKESSQPPLKRDCPAE